jgi:uncharacterized protein (TIGR03435 family)
MTAIGRDAHKNTLMQRLGIAGLVVLLPWSACLRLSGQEAPRIRTEKYEVASIRPFAAHGNSFQMAIPMSPRDGDFQASGITTKMLIQLAYGLRGDRIQGGPDWINSDLYSVHAKAEANVSQKMREMSTRNAEALGRQMLQSLLIDRFNLKVSQSTRSGTVSSLIVGKNGPRLHPSDLPKGDLPQPVPPIQVTNGVMAFNHASIDFLVNLLSQITQQEISNETGLVGVFDFSLHFRQERPGRPTDLDAPTLEEALSEQLGLKLTTKKGMVETISIEHIDRPTEN